MRKLSIGVLSLVAMSGATQAYAQSTQDRMPMREGATEAMDCKSEMMKAEPMVNAMTDETQKMEAMKEMSMAKDMMAKNDEAGCMAHMQTMNRMMQARPGQGG